MGARAQIKVDDIYLYTHWDSGEVIQITKEALRRKVRWDDSEYLARIIFCHLVTKDLWEEETGYGIGTREHGDIELLVDVDTDKQTVTVSTSNNRATMSFDKFIE